MRVSIAFDGSTPLATTLQLTDAAEAAGLDGVWNAEHLGLNDAVVPSAMQLARSRTMSVGLVGLNPDSRSPGLLAMEVASLCAVRAGQLILQVGVGSAELALLIGVHRGKGTLATVELFVDSLRRLLAGECVSASCDAFTLDDFQLRSVPPVPPRLDLMAMGPRMLDLAARVADGVSLSAGATAPYLREAVATARQRVADSDREPGVFAATALVMIGYDPIDQAAARARAARLLAYSPIAPMRRIAPELDLPDQARLSAALLDGGTSAAAACYSEATVEATTLVATDATLVRGLLRYAETGVDEVAIILTGSPARNLRLVAALGNARAELHSSITAEKGSADVR